MDDMREPMEWPVVFMMVARTIAFRSKDLSTQCGAVLVSRDNQLISTGFNGPPPQIIDKKVPWNKRPEKYFWIFHAEENAINFALDSHGSHCLKGATLYVTTMPCSRCILRMIRIGIERVIYDDKSVRPKMVDNSHEERTDKILSSLKFGTKFQLIPFSSLGIDWYITQDSSLHMPGRKYGMFWRWLSSWSRRSLWKLRLRQLSRFIWMSIRRLPGLGN